MPASGARLPIPWMGQPKPRCPHRPPRCGAPCWARPQPTRYTRPIRWKAPRRLPALRIGGCCPGMVRLPVLMLPPVLQRALSRVAGTSGVTCSAARSRMRSDPRLGPRRLLTGTTLSGIRPPHLLPRRGKVAMPAPIPPAMTQPRRATAIIRAAIPGVAFSATVLGQPRCRRWSRPSASRRRSQRRRSRPRSHLAPARHP